MPHRITITALVGVLALVALTVGGCGGQYAKPAASAEAAKTGEPVPAPGPPTVQWPNLPPGVSDVNRPGPQADPGSCVEGGERGVQFYAHWLSETDHGPIITWTKNGRATTGSNVRTAKIPRTRYYGGEWSTLVRAKCHDSLTIDVKGSTSVFSTTCAIVDLGDGPVKTGERNCAAGYIVP